MEKAFTTFILMHWKLGTSKMNFRKGQSGRLHLACIYMAQVRPFVKERVRIVLFLYTSLA